MKRICLILLLVVMCMSIIGCKDNDVLMGNKENFEEHGREEKNNNRDLDEYKEVLEFFDQFLKENEEKLNIGQDDILERVHIRRLSERYYLISYRTSPISPFTNDHYMLVDVETHHCKSIFLNSIAYIEDISFGNGIISFYSNGRNVINGFRDFPFYINYHIKTEEVTIENIFKSLEYSSAEATLGNRINQIKLNKVVEENKEILFDFGESEETFFAGGMFCPTIKVGMKIDDQDMQTFYIDFENLVLSKEMENEIRNLSKKDFITSVSIKEYEDVHENVHVVIYLKLKDVREYSCHFEGDEKGFMDFVIVFR